MTVFYVFQNIIHLTEEILPALSILFSVPAAGKTSVPWLEYDTARKMYLDIDTDISLRQNMKAKTVKFWHQDIPTINVQDDFKMSHDEL